MDYENFKLATYLHNYLPFVALMQVVMHMHGFICNYVLKIYIHLMPMLYFHIILYYEYYQHSL